MRRFLWVAIVSALLIAFSAVVPESAWTSVADLPAHPLFVHGVVVLVPLLSLSVIVGLFWSPLLRRTYLFVIAAYGVLAAGAIAAKKSGEQLAAIVGMPERHEQLGTILVPVTIALFVTFTLFALVAFVTPQKALAVVFAALVGLQAGASIPLTIVVGHSGADSVWGQLAEVSDEVEESELSSETSGEMTTAPEPAPVPTEALREISADEVRQHGSAEDCWTIVNGAVFDVTPFVGRHPGGQSAISQICGVDGSALFADQHSGQGSPERELAQLKIGVLAP